MSEHISCASCGASELGCRHGDCCDDCGHGAATWVGGVGMSEDYEEEWSDWTALSGYKTIVSADALNHYEWDQFHVLRGPDGRLYVGDDSGCSCNGFYDVSPADLTPVESWQDAGNRAQAWANDPGASWAHERRAGVAYELCATLARVRPPAVLAPDGGES